MRDRYARELFNEAAVIHKETKREEKVYNSGLITNLLFFVSFKQKSSINSKNSVCNDQTYFAQKGFTGL